MSTEVGIIGCGNISTTYLKNAAMFEAFDVTAVADLDMARARERADEFGVRALSVKDLLASDVEVVINLTIPAAHAEVALQALEAGKHVYNEKPLAVELEDARKLLDLARAKGLRVGCAPDTFLGAGWQTVRAFLDAGGIGQPVGASAHMVQRGPDRWHPDPEFFFKHGAGPLFDMGPYYLSAFVNFFGPVRRVGAFARATYPKRVIQSGAKQGQEITVETPTHVVSSLEFHTGPLVTLTVSFDAVVGSNTNIELYGSDGALVAGDPNMFSNHLRYSDGKGNWGYGNWHDLPVNRPYADNARGLGVADMIHAVQQGRPHRANGELAYHVLEVMHAILRAAEAGQAITIESRPERPEALPEVRPESILEVKS